MEITLNSDSYSTSDSANSVAEYVNKGYEDSVIVENPIFTVSSFVDTKDKEYRTDGNKLSFLGEQYLSESSDTPPSKRRFRLMYVVALAALMNALCVGMAVTYTATATADMQLPGRSLHPSDGEISWIGSILAIGALFGGLTAGHLSNSLGRKRAMLLITIPFFVGWMFIIYSPPFVFLVMIGRLLTGFGCGLTTVTTPMYLVEISTPEVRGLLGASFQLFIVIGVLIISGLGSVLNWTRLAVSGATMTIIAFTAICPLPETARWLVANGRYAEAIKVLKLLQGQDFDAESMCASIEEEIKSQPPGKITVREIFQPAVYKPTLLSIALMFFQQFSGVNAIMFYTVTIFESAGGSIPGKLGTIIVAAVQVLATLVSSVLMDKAGRKILLMISGVGMFVSLCVLGIYDLQSSQSEAFRLKFGILPVMCLMVFIAGFSLGFGPIPWLMVAEMTPARFRSPVSGLATGFNWFFVFTVTVTFHSMEKSMKGYGTYWMYSFLCLGGCFFTYFLIPETKGKPLEQIQEQFLSKKDRAKSIVYNENFDSI